MITHAARPGIDWNASPTFIVMQCGAWTMVDDDGGTSPPMDFYLPAHADKTDCPGCRARLTKQAAKPRSLARAR
jgi:hypothetical protein